MKKIRVGITSVGSGVGQSIVSSCRLSGLPLHLTGYGNNPFAFGAFDCDARRILPSIYSPEYVEALGAACRADRIDILIPGLDDELLLLAGHAESFRQAGTQAVVSGMRMIELCRDKLLMSRELSTISSAFVRGHTRSSLLREVAAGRARYPLIAKPLSGFASRGLFVVRDESDLARVTDAHAVQEVAVPANGDPNRPRFLEALARGEILQLSEISAQLLLGRDGREIGRFLSRNRLDNGVPVEIMPLDAPEVGLEIDKLLPYFRKAGLFGPLNLQGRLTDDGPRFFEMNARFTGITGLRALAGFNEVAAIIAELAGARAAALRPNLRKIGIRQVADRVVDIEIDRELTRAVESGTRFPPRKGGRRILVTGANGYLGRAVLDTLLSAGTDSIVAMVRHPERFAGGSAPPLPAGVEVVDAAAWPAGGFQMGAIDIICHLASGRPHHSALEQAESLRYTQALTAHAQRHQVSGFINASSQAVYGTGRPLLWTEELPPAPETGFAQAKWAAELMAASISELSPVTKVTSLRFAQLIGPSPVCDTARLVHKYVEAALAGKPLHVKGGLQRLDFLDLRDAAELVSILAAAPFADWPDILNAGGEPVSVFELANSVADAAAECGLSRPEVHVDSSFAFPDFGMSREKACKLLGWTPRYALKQSILDLFRDGCGKSAGWRNGQC